MSPSSSRRVKNPNIEEIKVHASGLGVAERRQNTTVEAEVTGRGGGEGLRLALVNHKRGRESDTGNWID